MRVINTYIGKWEIKRIPKNFELYNIFLKEGEMGSFELLYECENGTWYCQGQIVDSYLAKKLVGR